MERAGRWWWVWAWGLLARRHVPHGLGLAGIHRTALQPLLAARRPGAQATHRSAADALRLRLQGGIRRGQLAALEPRQPPTSPASAGTKRMCSLTRCSKVSLTRNRGGVAHELGHFRLKHVRQRLCCSIRAHPFVAWRYSLVDRAGRLSTRRLVSRCPRRRRAAAVRARGPGSYFLHHPACLAVVAPARVRGGRVRHAHAARRARHGRLVKLHRDNASTLTPDRCTPPFYYSHPPPLARIAACVPAARPPRS